MHVPFCSIVILNYNGEKFLEKTIHSVFSLNYPIDKYEIIIVDNASTDGSYDVLDKLKKPNPKIHLIKQTKNVGFSAGNNVGIKRAKGKYVVLLNNDCEVDTNWLKELVAVAEKDDKIFAVNPKVYLGKTNKIQNAGIRVFNNGYAQDRGAIPNNKVQEYEEDRGQYDNEEEINAVCAVATLYRKSLLDKIGAFDESFFLYYEDVEISYRARKQGYKLMYAPKALAYHLHSASSKELSPLFIYHSEKGRLLFLLYCFPLFTFVKELIMFEIKAKGRFIIRLFSQPKSSSLNFQYIKAFLFILFLWPYYLGLKHAKNQLIKSV